MSVDCDGACDIWTRKQQRARKNHKCDCCDEPIPRGHIYATHFTLYDGSTEYVKRCLRCEAIYSALLDKMNEVSRGEETPALRLDCGHEYEERWDEPPPEYLARLAFVTPEELQAEALAKMAKRAALTAEPAPVQPAQPAEPAATEETAWLLERPGPLYATIAESANGDWIGPARWGTDASAASRFASGAQALDVKALLDEAGDASVVAREHAWPRVRPAEPAGDSGQIPTHPREMPPHSFHRHSKAAYDLLHSLNNWEPINTTDWCAVTSALATIESKAAELITSALSGEPVTVEEGPLREALERVAEAVEMPNRWRKALKGIAADLDIKLDDSALIWRDVRPLVAEAFRARESEVQRLTEELRALKTEREDVVYLDEAAPGGGGDSGEKSDTDPDWDAGFWKADNALAENNTHRALDLLMTFLAKRLNVERSR